ncbi:hypothetical protein M8J77_014940 [Diaphorina citri]|nr:hypothetical protein M8J77_014940 [Diaphorina citri]
MDNEQVACIITEFFEMQNKFLTDMLTQVYCSPSKVQPEPLTVPDVPALPIKPEFEPSQGTQSGDIPIIIKEESSLPEPQPCTNAIQAPAFPEVEQPTLQLQCDSMDHVICQSTPEFPDFPIAMETLTTVYPDTIPRIPYSQDSNGTYQLDPSKFYPNYGLYIQVGEKRQFKRHFMDHVNSKTSKMKSPAQSVGLKSCQNQHQRPVCFSTRVLRHERPPALSRDHVLISCHV